MKLVHGVTEIRDKILTKKKNDSKNPKKKSFIRKKKAIACYLLEKGIISKYKKNMVKAYF